MNDFGLSIWGNSNFVIENGKVCVNAASKPAIIDIVRDIRDDGYRGPLLLRFPHLIQKQIEQIHASFAKAKKEFAYKGSFNAVFPLKVNQYPGFVKNLVRLGKPYNYGLEAGSKAELLLTMAYNNEKAPITVNGFKDKEMINIGFIAAEMGHNITLTIEGLNELEAIIAIAKERFKPKPKIGLRVRLHSTGSGLWAKSGGIHSKFGLTSTELIEALAGLIKVDSGTYFIDNDELENKTPKLIKEKGLSHIPEDRHKRATIDDFTMEENMALGLQDQYSKGALLDYSEIEKKTDEYIEKYDIRPTDGKIKFGGLSGGNQQKVVVARELERENKFIIAAQPTRGVDIGAIEMIHNTILNEKTQKKAIMLVSAELSEIMALSDRIAVMYSGRIVGILDRKDATTEKLGILMAGGKIND